MASKNSPITHKGILCTTCTEGTTIHANNVHRVTPKSHTAYVSCERGCQHPIYIQPVSGTFRAELDAWEANNK
jgi:hypothetical protein